MTPDIRLWTEISEDYAAYSGKKDFSPVRPLLALAVAPGYVACAMYRVQNFFWRKSLKPLAGIVRSINHAITGADFVPGCQLGAGLTIRHPSGIVIGHGAKVGRGCTILQQVTLGERVLYGEGPGQYPVVGENVILGAGSRVLGPVKIGDGAVIGANSVVFIDVPAGRTAVGVPARLLGKT